MIEEEYKSVIEMLHEEIQACNQEGRELESMINGIQSEISSFLKSLPTAFSTLYRPMD